MRSVSMLSAGRARPRVLLACVVLGIGLAAWWSSPAAVLTGPRPGDPSISRAVRLLMKNEHLLRHPLDAEIAARATKTLLESFDPRKLYFFQSDVDEFKRRQQTLVAEVNADKVNFVYDVFHRFLERLDQRTATLPELVAEEYDFSVDEEMITDADLLQYPKDEAEARARWRQLIKYNLLAMKADQVDPKEVRQKILLRYQSLAKRWHQTDGDELLERFLTSVTTSYDPHTSYMSPSTLENFRISLRLNLEGIGAALELSEEGYTVVSKIIPGGAADKHGKLKPEDRIVSVGQGEAGEMQDVVDMKLNDVVKLIRGPAGTVVRLGVRPAAGGPVQIYSITRERIELEDSAARTAILERSRPDGSKVKIGVIDLPSFYMDMEAARVNDGAGNYRSTTRDVRRILDDFTAKSIDVVVLDLRRNGGGSLTEAINLTGLFIDGGPVVQVKDSTGRVQPYEDPDPGMAWKGPLVVLTSKFSASASEILAGAIQDYRRGLVLGDDATHGKGTVQSMQELGPLLFPIPNPPDMGALKITMQQFYRPNGDSTQKRGVIPDVILPSLTSQIGLAEADLDYAIEFDRVLAARYTPYKFVPADCLSRLRARSEARIRESQDFAKLKEDIARYTRYKNEKRVPLREDKFMARRASERDAEKEEEKQFDDSKKSKEEVFKDDFYNREVLNITMDYLEELARKGEFAWLLNRPGGVSAHVASP